MHVISQLRIWEAKRKYPEMVRALDSWYRLIKKMILIIFQSLKKVLIA